MNVKAKFQCSSVKKYASTVWKGNEYSNGYLYEYEFHAVVDDGTKDNKEFFASTPSGTIKMSAVRDGLFEPGKKYYVYFEPEN